jgi:L-alanine-DL-glutamate epimerase-like enolase superfamily enzyme
MKITGVKATRRTGTAPAPAGSCCIVELSTDAGLTGIGIADAGVRAPVRRLVADMLVGADPRSVTGIWQRMMDAQSAGRRGSAQNRAVAVLDQALWDLKARANDEPLWKSLGGARPRANAYASSIGLSLDDEELSAWYLRLARDHGLRGGKLRVSTDENADARRLERMRAALAEATPEPVLMIDADHGWSVKQAIDRVRSIEQQFDLTWVEGVSRDRDARGLKQLSDAIRGAVCVGKGFATIGEFLPHLQRRSADVIQADINTIGITGALQVADAAFGLELPVTLSAAPGNIHAHLAGVMPHFMSVEIVDPVQATRLFTSDVRIVDGWAIAGDAPGNGLVLT